MMNSIREFVDHLGGGPLEDASWMDSRLLEKGSLGKEDFRAVFWTGNKHLAWVVVWEANVYVLSEVSLVCSQVRLYLQEIREGKCFTESVSLIPWLADVGLKMRLASCPVNTLRRLRLNNATKKVINRIKKAAQ